MWGKGRERWGTGRGRWGIGKGKWGKKREVKGMQVIDREAQGLSAPFTIIICQSCQNNQPAIILPGLSHKKASVWLHLRKTFSHGKNR